MIQTPISQLTSRAFWTHRKLSFFTLVATLAALFFCKLNEATDDGILKDYGISLQAFYLAYIALVILALLLLIFEPYLRQRPLFPKVLLGLSSGVSFVIVWLITDQQSQRLFLFPASLWLLIVNTVGLCAALVWAVVAGLPSESSWWLRRAALAAIVIPGVVLAILHVASLGEFMRLDVPDEPWLGSMATNFAENGDLSPTFLASAYGTPDPALGRYYLLMGLWLRLINASSLWALRAFPLLVAVVVILVFIRFLSRVPGLTRVQRVAGAAALIAMMAFVRTSHNLRMDIGLGMYSVVLLWGMIAFFDNPARPRHWPVLMGLAFYIGLETVPTLTLPLAFLVGLVFVVWAAQQPLRRWSYVGLYGLGCLAAGLGFMAGHFLPDPAAQWEGFQAFSQRYTSATNFGEVRDIWAYLFDVQVRFSLSLSPLELPISLLALAGLGRRGTWAERALLIVAVLQTAIMVAFLNTTFGYWLLFAPWSAYALARLLGSTSWLAVGSFVMLPALLAAPIHDLAGAIQRQANAHTIAQTEALADQIPPGVTIVGEPSFWFSLHQDHRYIGWVGAGLTSIRQGLGSRMNALRQLDVAVAICWSGYEDLCQSLDESGLFSQVSEFTVDSEVYLIYQR